MKSNAFPRTLRITRAPEIRAVLDHRCSVADDLYVVYGLRNSLGHPRLVFLVGKKHGNAVRRNRIKRRIREAFRLSRSDLPVLLDLAVIPRVSQEIPTLEESMRSLTTLATRLLKKVRRREAEST